MTRRRNTNLLNGICGLCDSNNNYMYVQFERIKFSWKKWYWPIFLVIKMLFMLWYSHKVSTLRSLKQAHNLHTISFVTFFLCVFCHVPRKRPECVYLPRLFPQVFEPFRVFCNQPEFSHEACLEANCHGNDAATIPNLMLHCPVTCCGLLLWFTCRQINRMRKKGELFWGVMDQFLTVICRKLRKYQCSIFVRCSRHETPSSFIYRSTR